jgi:hypothetical protein
MLRRKKQEKIIAINHKVELIHEDIADFQLCFALRITRANFNQPLASWTFGFNYQPLASWTFGCFPRKMKSLIALIFI